MTAQPEQDEPSTSLTVVTEQHAKLAFWLFPRFVCWVKVHSLQHHLGGYGS